MEFQAKVYDESSMYGINGGRISKLSIRYHGFEIYNYDRGLDINKLLEDEVQAMVNLIEAIS